MVTRHGESLSAFGVEVREQTMTRGATPGHDRPSSRKAEPRTPNLSSNRARFFGCASCSLSSELLSGLNLPDASATFRYDF